MPLISQNLIDRYSAGPSTAKTAAVAALQSTIRAVVGEDDYDTFLQGSYRNDTANADINDVDIIARRKATRAPLTPTQWEALFDAIAAKLRTSYRISGTVTKRDKCVNLSGSTGGLTADIVPAAAIGDFTSDPIAIYSRRQRQERPNFPRTHYEHGVDKQRYTQNAFKPTVRLFKRWAWQYPGFDNVAPSFYIECAVHYVSSGEFNSYLPLSFASVGLEICSWPRTKYIASVAGDKDILVANEWHPDNFERFKAKLRPDIRLVINAMNASTTGEANRLWKLAFGE